MDKQPIDLTAYAKKRCKAMDDELERLSNILHDLERRGLWDYTQPIIAQLEALQKVRIPFRIKHAELVRQYTTLPNLLRIVK